MCILLSQMRSLQKFGQMRMMRVSSLINCNANRKTLCDVSLDVVILIQGFGDKHTVRILGNVSLTVSISCTLR